MYVRVKKHIRKIVKQKKSRQRIQAKKVPVLQVNTRPVQIKKIAASKKRRLRGPRAGLLLAVSPPEFSLAPHERVFDTNTVQSTLHEEIYLEISTDVATALEGQDESDPDDMLEEPAGETEESSIVPETSPSIAIIDFPALLEDDGAPSSDVEITIFQRAEESIEPVGNVATPLSVEVAQTGQVEHEDVEDAADNLIETVEPGEAIERDDDIDGTQKIGAMESTVTAQIAEPTEAVKALVVPTNSDLSDAIEEPVILAEPDISEVIEDTGASAEPGIPKVVEEPVILAEPDISEVVEDAEAPAELDIPKVVEESAVLAEPDIPEVVKDTVTSADLDTSEVVEEFAILAEPDTSQAIEEFQASAEMSTRDASEESEVPADSETSIAPEIEDFDARTDSGTFEAIEEPEASMASEIEQFETPAEPDVLAAPEIEKSEVLMEPGVIEAIVESEALPTSETNGLVEHSDVSEAVVVEEVDLSAVLDETADDSNARTEPIEEDDWDTTTEKMTSVRLLQFAAVATTAPPAVDAPETPELQDAPVASVELEKLPVTPPLEEPQPTVVPIRKKRIHSLSSIFTYILLAMIISLLFTFWHDLSVTHIYATTFDARSGKLRAKQDISTFQDNSTLTAPVTSQGSVLLGMQSTDTQSKSQIMVLQGGNASWQVQKTFTASLPPGSVSVAPGGELLIENTGGMQVFSPSGDLLWQLQSAQPALGAHPFQPVSDGQTVYTLSTVQSFQVGAYNLKTGAKLWTRKLDDTMDFAPPLVLDGATLYIAGDHNLYAVNTGDGSLHWQKTFAARTLLVENEGKAHLLVAAGAHGLIGLDPATGINAWTFRSLPGSTITPAQFYQATLGKPASSAHQIVYATGVVWQMPQVQEYIWLYAIDAPSGTLLWSHQIASGIIGTDAGRFLMPVLDAPHAIVALQQQVDSSSQYVLGFDANSGIKRWSQLVKGLSSAAPSLLAGPDGSLLLLTSTGDFLTLLLTPTSARLALLLLAAFAAVCLLLLNLVTLPGRLSWLLQATATGASRLRPSIRHLHDHRRLLLKVGIFMLTACIITAGVLAYFWLSKTQEHIYQFSTASGATQWQRSVNASTQVLRVDEQGSIVVIDASADQHELQAVNTDGSVRWHMFNTEGTFFLPDVPSQPGTVLVALSGHSTFSYRLAPDDPAYPRALDHLLALYLLDRNTGTPIWQHIVFYPDEQQNATILGSDANYIYVASTQANLVPGGTGPAVQLLSVNQATGTIDWRVFGPVLPNTTLIDHGKLFLQGNQAIWQVASTVYAIDTTVGQIAWRRPLASDAPDILAHEEGNMEQVAGLLLVARSNAVHALDSASGNEVWTIASPGGAKATQTSTAVSIVGQTILISKQAQLYAFDSANRRLLWDQQLTGPIQQLRTSDDGKMLYAIVTGSGQKSAPALLALDAQTGTIRWKFTQSEQFSFSNAESDGYKYRIGRLFVSTCLPSQDTCNQQQFYAIDALTGKTLWSFSGSDLGDIRISADGRMVALRITRTLWSDLIAQL